MIVLGIDPGLAKTGFGIIESRDGRCRSLEHGTLSTTPQQSIGTRLDHIYTGIMEVIDRFRPDGAGIENLYFARNRASAFPVAQARGVLLLALAQRGIPIRQFPPQEIKQAVTGSGRAAKEEVQNILKLLLGLDSPPSSDHAADALAAALCYYHYDQSAIGSMLENRAER
jgi:crossover junction endodeoxyribonuclease RuvC